MDQGRHRHEQSNNRRLTNRKVAVASSVFGLLEVFIGTFAAICGFVLLGGFCENLDCPGISRGLGLWIGFPLIVPGLLGIVVLATRHNAATLAYMIMNAVVMIFSIVHTVLVYKDYDDFWKKQKDDYDADKCSLQGSNKCICGTKVYSYQCDLIELGYELNWIMFGLSIAAMFLCACGIICGILGRALVSVKRADR